MPAEVVPDLRLLQQDAVAGPVTERALTWLGEFAETHQSLIPAMAGRAEELVGDPEDVAQQTWALIQDILDSLNAAVVE